MARYALLALLLPTFAQAAVKWSFQNSPRSCETLSIQASGGTPPYSFLMIPAGPSLIAGGSIEVRKVMNITFNGTDSTSTLDFTLPYPANETFVGVVSDASGFGSGGVSSAVTVLTGNSTSCYDSSKNVQGRWTFSSTPGTLTQCQSTRFWWQQTNVTGTVRFNGVIPGGNAFDIPVGTTTKDDNGTGFSWKADISPQTQVYIVAGDDQGPASSAPYTIIASDDSSCLASDSPASTAGSPAGGSYPTSTDGSTTGGGNANSSGGSSSGGGTNVGAIVGGVVGGIGGLIAVVLLAWFLLFRKRKQRASYNKERPVNILQDDDDDQPRGNLPQYYEPQPFTVPDPTVASTADATSVRDGTSEGGALRPGTPAGMSEVTSSSRKTAMPRMRPVNIVQHEDAGPSAAPAADEQPETVELPPAYTNLRAAPNASTATEAQA
ncbi:hypothetical protein PENSPDRAFT_677941 [Peniophora sp. CONT]|nr:hypothetical protein PENSPDRAFT_677941 [Peniophora sp. CONT]